MIEALVSLGHRCHFVLHTVDAVAVHPAIGILALVVKPLILAFQEGDYLAALLRTSVFLMRTGKIGLPTVDLGLQLILLLVGLEDDTVLIDHSGLCREEGLDVFTVEVVEGV